MQKLVVRCKKIFKKIFAGKYFLFTSFCLLLSTSLLAGNEVTTLAHTHRQDSSVSLLSFIFGYVSDVYSDVLYGESILKPVFETLNASISMLGVIIVSYITIVSLVNSAHSGTPLGQKWHSMFLPIRIAFGSGLLLPNPFTGYSFAQSLIMWFILSGVNIANKVWDEVILSNSFTQGIFNPDGGPKIPSNIENNELAGFFDDLRVFAICVGSFSEEISKKNITDDNEAHTISLGIKCQNNSEPASCRDADTLVPEDPAVAQACKSLSFSFGNNLHDEVLQSYARLEMYSLVQDIISSIQSNPIAQAEKSDKSAYQELAEDLVRHQLMSFSYLQGIINSQDRADKRDLALEKDYGARNRAIGWITAGTFYYELLKSGPLRLEGSPSIGDFKTFFKNPSLTEPVQNITEQEFLNNLNSKTQQIFLEYDTIFAKKDKFGEHGKKEKLQFNPINTNKDLKILDFLTIGLNRLVNFLIKEILNTKNLLGYADETDILSPRSIGESLKVDPLNRISMQGDSLLVLTEELISSSFWVLIATYGIGIATSLIPLAGFPAMITMIAVSVGVVFAVVGFFLLFYPIGILMNIYIPLIPLFVWLFGVISWLLICIEAMVAAPIVAIGLMHPDGNEVLGKAEQGLMMILNLMLRPVLMVVGFVAAVILVRVAILLFSWGINIVLGSGLMQLNSTGAIIALSFIYAGLLSMFVQQSFRLINQVPDKVLTWIGGPGAGIGEEPFTQQVKQEVESGSRRIREVGLTAKSDFGTGFGNAKGNLSK